VSRKAIVGMIRAVALAAALFLAGGAIPVLGGLALIFAPAPIIIYAVGRSRPNLRAILSVLLTTVLVGLAAGPYGGAAYLASFGIGTAIICYMLERRYSFELIIAVTAGVMFAAIAATAVLTMGGPDALVAAIHTQLAQAMKHGQELYKYVGIDASIPADTQASVIALTMRLTPAFSLVLAALAVLVNLRLFWRWAGQQRLAYSLFPDLSRWSAPEWLVWLLLAAGFGMFIPVNAASDIALNAFICAAAIYFCQGLAIIRFYFQTLGVPAIVRILIYFLLAHVVVAALVCIAGVFDMWIDFRRLKPPSQEAGSFGDFF
jgi:uncharacterized protein YybS (DUF2232 family)